MKRTILAVAALAAVALAANAAPPKKEDPWGAPNTLRDLLKKAAAEDNPVVILYQIKASTCPKHNAKVELFQKQTSLKGMELCRFFANTASRQITPLRQAIPHLRFCPFLMFTDGEDHLIGYVPYEGNPADVLAMARLARETTQWKKQARATLPDVATQTEQKQFSEALAAVARLDLEDRELTGRIQWSIRKVCQKSPKPPADAASGATDQAEGDAPDKNARDKTPAPDADKAPDAADDQDKLPARPEPADTGMFMAKPVADAARSLRLAIDDHLTRARILLVQGDLKAAEDALGPLLAIQGDDDLRKKALDIKADLDKARSEAAPAPTPTPTQAPTPAPSQP